MTTRAYFSYLRAVFFACLFSLASFPVFAQPSAPDLDNELVLTGLNAAVGVTFDEAGVVYIWEKAGKIFIVENGVKRNTPLLDISDEVGNWRDFGLLGVALDPNYLNNGYIYCLYVVDRHFLMNYDEANPPGAGYNANADEYFNATIGRITRFTVNNPSTYASAAADLNSRHILLGDQVNNGFAVLHQSHGVGTLLFGEDGTLLASCGDGASYFTTDYGGSIGGTYTTQALSDGIINQTQNVGAFRSQSLSSLNGKVIRIDPSTGEGLSSNPYYDPAEPNAAKSKVWALGFRNPFRMTLRPGSGSHFAGDGNPGALYVGDVGWQNWDELNIVHSPGQNFGWPIFEGMDEVSSYVNNAVPNLDAPTPSNCGGQSHYLFTDLIKQSLGGGGNQPFTNPCGSGAINPSDAELFVHQKPTFTTAHQQNLTKVSINGHVQNVGNGNANSVPGSMFPGNCSIGGTWYVGTDLPVEYQNTYFHADYGEKWIRNFGFDTNQEPLWVRDFDTDVPNKGSVVCVASHPLHGGLYFIRYGSQLRRMVYNPSGNQKPTAVATQDVSYGPSPLSVQFNGSQSTDPENNSLSYSWNFGDGSTSNQTNPSHTFTAAGNAPTQYDVTLIVTDNGNLKDSAKLVVSVNNTPPVIQATSVDGTDFYSMVSPTQLALSATVSDAEHSQASLELAWQVFLYHNNHNHPEPIEMADFDEVINTVISPVGCDGETYFYRVELTVSDPAGLSSFYYKDIYPDCGGGGNSSPVAVANADQTQGSLSLTVNFDGTSSYDTDGNIATYDWDFGDGSVASGTTASHTFGPGSFQVVLTVVDSAGAFDTDQLQITVEGPNQPPVANLSATPNPVTLGDAINFDGSGSTDGDGSIQGYAWDFDDGTQGTGITTSHTYADTGWYEVALTVLDDEGASGVQSLSVRVDTVVLPPPSLGLKLEKGILTNVGANWESISLNYSYTNMVVITTPLLSSGSQLPVVSRIRNTSGNSFELKVQGFGSHVPSGYSVHYLVVEAGAYTLADDGVQMEAGTFVSTKTAGEGNWTTEARSYQQAYNNPVVLGQVMSYNDPNWSVFWANGNSRSASPTATSFHAGKNVGEDPNTNRANETIGYVVVESGSGAVNDIDFSAGIGGDQVKGLENNSNGYLYPPTGMTNPGVAIVSMGAGMDATDGGWPILFGPNPVTNNGLILLVDEDQAASTERRHSTESLPYLVFESGPPNQAPTAVASADQTQGSGSLSVVFDGSGSSDSDGSIVDHSWDFGDGNGASGASVSHTFGPGLFEVILTVTDDLGEMGSDTLTIEVGDPNQAPTASFTVSPSPASLGQSVSFDASGSTDGDGSIVSYAWDFDDGGNTASGLNASYTFSDTGSYAVSLTVTDDDGATDVLSQQVRVNPVVVSTGVKYEIGVLTNVGASWQTIPLTYSYTNMVVITTPLLTSGNQLPVVSRIDQTSGNSFDLKLQGFSGNVPSGYAVHYLVIEAGTYTLADDGVKMEAGTFSSTQTAGEGNWNTEARSYQQNYSAPVVFGQVMSYNDPNWSVFWANGSGRSDSPTPGQFHAGKNVGEDPNQSRATETLGYVVLESGNGSLNGTAFEAGIGSDIVKGLENSANGFLYPLNGLVNPEVALVSMGGGMDATDGGWPILFGNNAVSSNGLTLLIDEDQVTNTERRHSTESVSFLAFEGATPRLKKPSDLSIHVFPNPFQKYLQIEVEGSLTSEVEVRISNAMGQQLLQTSSSQARFTLELTQAWPAGLYVIQVQAGGVSRYFRLLKEE